MDALQCSKSDRCSWTVRSSSSKSLFIVLLNLSTKGFSVEILNMFTKLDSILHKLYLTLATLSSEKENNQSITNYIMH